MLTPDQVVGLSDNIVDLYAEFEMTILNDIARRINKMDYLTPTARFQIELMQELGVQQKFIIKEIAKLTPHSEQEVARAFKYSNIKSQAFTSGILSQAGLEPLASDLSKRLIMAEVLKTNNNLKNLTMTTAETSQKMFIQSANQAHLQVTTGVFDQETAIRNAIKRSSTEGTTILYTESGKAVTRTIESAVRMVVSTGANQSTMKIQEMNIDELGVNLVETSAHAGARPDHQVWQGKVFSWEGKNKKYPNFQESTLYGDGAGIGGWNCKHSWYPYFEDESISAYTQKQLKDYNAKNITYNGDKMTEYEASQIQRYNERGVRRWKRQANSLEQQGFDATRENEKVREWQARQRDLIKQTGLIREYPREFVAKSIIKAPAQKEKIINGAWDVSNGKRLDKKITSGIDERIRKLNNQFPVKNAKFVGYGDHLKLRQASWDEQFEINMKSHMGKNPKHSKAKAEKSIKNIMTDRATAQSETGTAGEFFRNEKGFVIGINNNVINSSVTYEEALLIRKEKFKRQKLRVAEGKKRRDFFIVGDCPEITAIHEYGHLIDQDLKGSKGYYKLEEFYKKQSLEGIEKDLSRYASTNKAEFFAEAFTEMNLPDARPLAIEFKNVLMEVRKDAGY